MMMMIAIPLVYLSELSVRGESLWFTGTWQTSVAWKNAVSCLIDPSQNREIFFRMTEPDRWKIYTLLLKKLLPPAAFELDQDIVQMLVTVNEAMVQAIRLCLIRQFS